MPSPTTAQTLIEDALGLTNAVGVDQTLTADEVSDCLRVFNDVLEEWSTQDLAVYGQADQTFNTVATQATYTIGASGNWNTVRPVRLTGAYATVSGVSFPYTSISPSQYNQISYKAQAGGGTDLNQYFVYVNEYPLGLVTLWPVPNAVIPVTLAIDKILTAVASAATSISFPPGYAKAFKYTMGVELAPLFGKKVFRDYPDVVAIQKQTFGDIKRANQEPVALQYDQSFVNQPASGYPDGP